MKQISRIPAVTRAFRDLKGKTMNEISVEEYDSLVDAAFMQPSNKELMEDLKIIGSIKQSSSGPRAGGSKIVSKEYDDAGDAMLFAPGLGEVWILQEISLVVATSSTSTFSISLAAGGNSMQASQTVSTTSNVKFNSVDLGFPNTTFYVDENTSIWLNKTGSFSTVGAHLMLTRVR